MSNVSLFTEDHPVDDASMKLSLAGSILNALHEQHMYLDEKPTLKQADIAGLIYAAMQMIEVAHQTVQSMDYRANMPASRKAA